LCVHVVHCPHDATAPSARHATAAIRVAWMRPKPALRPMLVPLMPSSRKSPERYNKSPVLGTVRPIVPPPRTPPGSAYSDGGGRQGRFTVLQGIITFAPTRK